jgi:carbonic anhydrase
VNAFQPSAAPRQSRAVGLRALATTTLTTATLAASVLAAPVWAKEEKPGGLPHWQYAGKEGPKQWGALAPEFAACAKGKTQTPIDIKGAVPADLPELKFSYSSEPLTIVNNGHTVQVNIAGNQTLAVGDRSFKLAQFHFHTPSEEAINGKRYDMVAHFVHRDAAGALGVVAVLLQRGKADNAAFKPVFDNLPAKRGEPQNPKGVSIDLAKLLPSTLGYYAFAGSLTTPPCSEGVSWMVLRQPVQVSDKQLKQFRRIYAANARPLQPLNERTLQQSK